MAIYAAIGATEQTALEQVGGNTSGGGATVIPDEGTISGTYEGNVVCENDVTMTGPVIVNGDLTVPGNLYNPDCYELVVNGTLTVAVLYFVPAIPTTPQSNITVRGDLLYIVIIYPQQGGSAATLFVGGNMTGFNGLSGSPVYASGDDDTNGANVIVYGNLTASYEFHLYGGEANTVVGGNGGNLTVYGDFNFWGIYRAYGGDAGAGNNAGNGGYVTVWGNLTVGDGGNLEINGGSSDGGLDAGYGGTLEVYGNCTMGQGTISSYGGGAYSGGRSGGDGGSVYVYGNLVVEELSNYGGDSYSDGENDKAGQGGEVYVYGDVAGYGYFDLTGGYRNGTLSTGGSAPRPDAGSIYCYGNLTAYQIDAYGGDVYTTGDVCCAAGEGGTIDVYGNLRCDYVYAYGGYADTYGNGGNGGNLYIKGDANCYEISTYGGDAYYGNGGDGDEVYIDGSAVIGDMSSEGGGSAYGNSGNGGNVYILGPLYLDDSYNGSGGNCSSTDNSKSANYSGSLYVGGLQGNATINLNGGNRSGATTASGSLSSFSGGEINVEGDATFYQLFARGGNVTTTYPIAEGGDGGYANFYGNVACDSIYLDGGDSVGGFAPGSGNQITIKGTASVNSTLSISGGDSNNSAGIGGDATNPGSGGTVILKNGGQVSYLDMSDGSGTGPGLNIVDLYLNGHCGFYQLSMADRSNARIRAYFNSPVTLKMGIMNGKTTLNNVSGSPSNDISALVTDNLFIAGGGIWYAIAGTSIFGP